MRLCATCQYHFIPVADEKDCAGCRDGKDRAPHEFDMGGATGTPVDPCAKCGLPDRHPIHNIAEYPPIVSPEPFDITEVEENKRMKGEIGLLKVVEERSRILLDSRGRGYEWEKTSEENMKNALEDLDLHRQKKKDPPA